MILTRVLFPVILFLSTSLFAEEIKKIDINGLNTISRGTVLSYLPFESGDDFKTEDNNKVVDALFTTGFFRKISVNFDKNKLIIDVIESPTIKFFDIKGYSDGQVLSNDIVQDIMKNFNLEPGKIYIPSKLSLLVSELKKLYSTNGYFSSSIKVSSKTDQENRIDVSITIEENDPAKISSFNIEGNNFFDNDDLLDEFEIGEADFFLINFFTKKDIFNRVKLNAGLEKLRSLYLENGFLDFNFYDPSVKFNEDKNSIDINLKISEGVQYNVGDIKFSEEIKSLVSGFDDLFILKTGDVLNRKILVKSSSNINKEFANKGYAYANVETIFSRIRENKIDLFVKVDKGNLVSINRIEISGNTRTQDNVIRRQLLLLEGQVYSDKDFNDSISNIKRMGFFSDVRMQALKNEKFEDKIDIFVEVEESKTGEFSIGVSHSNSTGASFNLGIQENNFLGTGNTLKAKFNNSKAVKETSFYFLNPHINSLGHSASIGFFSKSLDAANLDVSSYQIDENGFSSGYGVPITSNSDFFADLNFSKYDIKCGDVFSSSGYEQSQCASNDKNELGVSLKYSHNSLNDFYFPTSGEKTNLTSKLALPILDLNYYKIEVSKEKYSELSENLSLKVEGSLSFAKGYNNKVLPFYKRFYGGGTSSIRGFNFNSLGSVYPNGKAKGGELSILSNISLITPFTLANNGDKMKIGGFIDAGGISDTVSSFDASDFKASAGVAFTWLTPIGPLGFHAAKPLIKKDGDELKTFEFNLGSSF